MLARRIAGKFLTPKAEHLKERVEKVNNDGYIQLLNELKETPVEGLRKLYKEREREPDLAEPGKWIPEDTTYL
jgi:hypothetical protein